MTGDLDEPVFSGKGEHLILDINAIAAEHLILPDGTYTFTETEVLADKTFTQFSSYGETDAEGSTVVWEELKSGVLKVSRSGDVYTIDVSVKTTSNKTVKCVYVGKIDFEDASSGGSEELFKPIGEDVFTSFVMAQGTYYGTTLSAKEQFKIDLFDYLYEGTPYLGHTMTLEFYGKPVEGTILPPPGTYTVGARDADEYGILLPGWGDNDSWIDRGTRCMRMIMLDDQNLGAYYTFATTGTVEIAVSGNEYTITLDLADENGYKIQGDYKGAIEFKNKSYYTTLTEDYEVVLTDAPCEVDYYGQWFLDMGVEGDNWGIYIGTNKNGAEMMQIELLAPHGSYANGIPVGEYTVSLDYTTGDYTCIPAEVHGLDLYYSWYFGGFDGGISFKEAPFKAGKVTVAREGDNYTIAFDATDDHPDKPNRITGTWTGKPKFTDKSNSAPQAKAPRVVRAAKAK